MKELMILQTENEEETKQLAEELAAFLSPSQVIRLEGTLGAGKTTFTKGLAKGLEINRTIKSPTYTLIREYMDGAFPLYHIDLYRLEGGGAEELGLDEYFYGSGLTVIEWGSMAEEVMPEEYLLIELEVLDPTTSTRQITLTPFGAEYEDILEKLSNNLNK